MIVTRGRHGGDTERRGPTFSGPVFADSVLPASDGVVINSVTFLPRSRTFWHSHERGQILQVTSGAGIVCPDGGTPVRVRAGDTIWVPPGERHWHGGTDSTLMTHIAVSLGRTAWDVEVTEDDYETGCSIASSSEGTGT